MIIAVNSLHEAVDPLANVEPMDFSSMGMMEAAHYCQNVIEESWNDLKFGIMMEEYKFLYENGVEMVYEAHGEATVEDKPGLKDTIKDKAGAAKDKAVEAGKKGAAALSNIKEKAIALLKKFFAMVEGLINKAITNIRARAIAAGTAASGRSILSRKEFKEIASKIDDWKFQVKNVCKIGFTEDPFNLGNKNLMVQFGADVEPITAEAVVKEYTREFTDDDVKYFTPDRVEKCVYDGFKEIGKGILKIKKDADTKVKAAMKDVQKAKSDSLGSIMDKYKAAQKHNIAVVSGMLTVYNIYARQCRAIVNGIKSYDKIKNATDDRDFTKVHDIAQKNRNFANKMNTKNAKDINPGEKKTVKKLFAEKKKRKEAGQE